MQVEIWSDVVCPWCYLGKRRFEKALAAFAHRGDVDVVYRSFELDPSATTGTITPTVELLASKYGMTVQQAEDAQRQMEQRAAQDGLTFRMDGLRSGNTRDAHRLLHLAKDRDRQAELIERLHRAYFTDLGSVFDHASLADLAVEVGLDRDEVMAVLDSDKYADAVDDDEATARALGANGVPFFVIDRRYGISGAQPAAAITQALERAWES
ncbi:MAG TPA: DsbA family oxidoreductase [Jatrophihabitans sp.]|jgi:predicted DsbA family dithiol-disulfide isomerase